MPDSEPPPPPRQPSPALVRKAELEAAMVAAPGDGMLRVAYFELLTGLAGSNSGLLFAHLPDIEAPLAFRPGTPDLPVLADVFRDRSMAVELAAEPRRILVIGAHAGYSTVDFARRYPRAEILAVEPLADNLRLLRINTGPWRRIRIAPVAAWHSASRVTPMVRMQGDWAVRLADEGLDGYRVLPALPVGDILAEAGWDHADLVVCDATGSEREIFADRFQPWIGLVDNLLIRLYDVDPQTGGAAVTAAFPAESFERRSVGEFELFSRREPRTLAQHLPPERALLRTEPGLTPFRVADAPATAWGFFLFDGASCQLHPSGVATAPSRAIFGVGEAGYARFQSGIVHAGLIGAEPIAFTVFVVRNDGSVAAQASAVLNPQHSDRLSLKLPDLPPPYHIVLQTETAPGGGIRLAWARWLDPRLV